MGRGSGLTPRSRMRITSPPPKANGRGGNSRSTAPSHRAPSVMLHAGPDRQTKRGSARRGGFTARRPTPSAIAATCPASRNAAREALGGSAQCAFEFPPCPRRGPLSRAKRHHVPSGAAERRGRRARQSEEGWVCSTPYLPTPAAQRPPLQGGDRYAAVDAEPRRSNSKCQGTST